MNNGIVHINCAPVLCHEAIQETVRELGLDGRRRADLKKAILHLIGKGSAKTSTFEITATYNLACAFDELSGEGLIEYDNSRGFPVVIVRRKVQDDVG